MNPIFRTLDDCRRALVAADDPPLCGPLPVGRRPTPWRDLLDALLDALVQGSDGDEDGDFLDPGRAAAVYGTDVNGTTMDPDWHRR